MLGSVDNPFFDLTVDTITFRLLGGFGNAPALYVDAGVRYFALDMTASIPQFRFSNLEARDFGSRGRHDLPPAVQQQAASLHPGELWLDGTAESVTIKGSSSGNLLSHLLLGGGWGWMYMRVDGTIRAKDVHLSRTLNGPMLSLGIPF